MRLSRRSVLRAGSGALLALPFLESLLGPAVARAEGSAPRRVLFIYTPNGHNMRDWTPSAQGPGYALTPILEPLARHRERLTVVSGLWNWGCQTGADGHAGSSGAYLTCASLDQEETFNGVSIDQRIAAEVGSQTPFPSLELGMESSQSGACGGSTCGYSSNISWSGPQTPRAKVVDPATLFTRLFGQGAAGLPPQELARRKELRLSVLDGVADDLARLHRALPSADRQKLDEYTTAVRELETRLVDAPERSCDAPDQPAEDGTFPERLDAFWTLMARAMQCDLCRVFTFMLGNAATNQAYGFAGVPSSHHGLSHHGGDEAKLASLTTIGRWQSARLAELLDLLAALPDVDGRSLLDNTTVLYGSGMSDGHYHLNEDLPLLVAGQTDAFVHGQHVRIDKGSLADLHLTLARSVGVELDSHGVAGTGPLDAL